MMQVDNREDPKIFKALDRMKVKYSKEQLLVGDYYEPEKGDIIIERKTIEDFLESYISGHMAEQCANMEDNFEENYLFISGEFKSIFFKPLPPQLKHLKTESFHKMKIHLLRSFPKLRIVEFPSDTQLLKGVVELFSYEGNKRLANIIRRKASKEDVFLSQICCIPGIGLERAKRILKTIGSTYKLFDASPKALEEIDGIGKVQANRIKEYFSP